jgi:uncharacterized membrane protein YphA (DoxX/SURF4 family)
VKRLPGLSNTADRRIILFVPFERGGADWSAVAIKTEVPPRFIGVTNALWIPGRILFSLAIVALGFETIVCARLQGYFLGPGPAVIPCLPWLPAIPLLAGVFGVIWASCGMGLLARRGLFAARALGILLVLSAFLTILPKCISDPMNVFLRTALFESFALAAIALLQRTRTILPKWCAVLGRLLLASSLVVFGFNLVLSLSEVAKLLPPWIAAHEMTIEVYAGGLVVGGLCVGLGFGQRWVPAALGLMFALLVFTVHLPGALGSLFAQNALPDPNRWSDLLVSLGLWGGMWTLVRPYTRERKTQERPVYAGRATGGPPSRFS